MMRAMMAIVLLLTGLPVQAEGFWSSLWRTGDQQGAALMQQGDATAAAKVYTDPRRKAYAKINAGDYAGAVQDLENLHSSDDDYNRGNALAHAGDLQAAIDAYDAALKSNPNHQDAKHNRELVANALKQQPSQQQKSGGKDKQKEGEPGKDSSDQNKQDANDKQGDQNNNASKEKSDQAENKSGKGQDDTEKNKPQQPDKNSSKSQENTPSKESDAKDKTSPRTQSAQGNNPAEKNKDAAKDDTEQARRDIAATLGKPESAEKKGEAAGIEENPNKLKASTVPKTEQQLAKEQWLRSIPEDPGGLLRRKFLIEHEMRQRNAQK